MKEWLRYFWNKFSPLGREYNAYIDQLRLEQDYTRKHRVFNWVIDEYPLQQGMLPKNWQKIKPKKTNKHNGFTWGKIKK